MCRTLELISRVELLETAYENDLLLDYLQDETFTELLPSPLLKGYQSLVDWGVSFKVISRRPFAEIAINNSRCLVAEEFDVLYSGSPIFALRALEPGVHGPLQRLCSEILTEPPEVNLRLRQLIHLRKWGIGITTADVETNNLIERCANEEAKHLLIRDISAINRIQSRMRKLGRSMRIRPEKDTIGIRFEQLICDILNEHRCIASSASSDEDLLEQTDLRVKPPGLKRVRGARVQVTIGLDRHLDSKIASLRRSREMIVISPLTVAQACIDELRAPAISGFEAELFWSEIQSQPTSLEELSEVVRRVFVRAIELARTHPGGPAFLVPPMLRRVIQGWVEHQCFFTTAALRLREETESMAVDVAVVDK